MCATAGLYQEWGSPVCPGFRRIVPVLWVLRCSVPGLRKILFANHKIRHPRCVYNKLDWSVYTCLTQLYGDRDMYNLLHKELHVSALFIGHLQVDK